MHFTGITGVFPSVLAPLGVINRGARPRADLKYFCYYEVFDCARFERLGCQTSELKIKSRVYETELERSERFKRSEFRSVGQLTERRLALVASVREGRRILFSPRFSDLKNRA